MKVDVAQIEGFAIKLLDGTAKVYPPAAPLVVLIEGILQVADEYGIIPHEMPAAQAREMAAHGAADRASAVTSYRAHHPEGGQPVPYQDRVVIERRDLADKLSRLNVFRASDAFAALALVDQGQLVEQETYMAAYLRVLDERIKRFSGSAT